MSEENPNDEQSVDSGQLPDDPPHDAPEPEQSPKKEHVAQPRWRRLKNWYGTHKKWTIPATVIIIIGLLVAIPSTRYPIVGLGLKKDLNVRVLDAATGTPVSGAMVRVGSTTAETGASGDATIHHISVGHHDLLITKKYYQSTTTNAVVPIFGQKNIPTIKLTATGRQVKIKVSNLVNKAPLSGVDITVAGISAKTDTAGTTVLVLPVGKDTQQAKLSLKGFNDSSVTVKVSNSKIEENNYTLTPSGKVYFLSNLSGNIDVVKTNLDGTDRQTVLAGTGNEDDRNTVLLASRDWKYLALLSRRAGNTPSLYLIDTSSDDVSTIDEGNADFDLAGWAGDNFIYTVIRKNVQPWQDNREAIKSYNASARKRIIIDQTTASGSNDSNYISQTFGNVYAYGSYIYYTKGWEAGYNLPNPADFASKQATFNSVNVDGSGKKALRSFALADGAQNTLINLDEKVVSPNEFELSFYNGDKYNFYMYSNGQVKHDGSMNTDKF
ncbi:MAG TPA: carboxypeptidase-like regulatory domain-containing protein, partial [Candidatus Saccharimonadales bacterium]|nr:carboxypeptidase-like regulatory domain-containing protein [Candidatus Saccharimonadales bacterium]